MKWRRQPAFWALGLAGLALAATAVWYLRFRPTDAELLKAAIKLIDRGRAEAALPLLEKLLSRNPSESTALLHRGQLARDAGDLFAAAAFWRRVPDHPSREAGMARFLEGSVLIESYRIRDAEAALLKSVELHPDNLRPHELLLKIYFGQLRTHETRRELEAIRSFRPWTLDELHQSIDVTGDLSNRILGMSRIEKFAAVDPDDVASLVALSRYYMWVDRHHEAAGVLRQALSRRSDDPSIRAYLAEALLGEQELPAAQDVLRKAPLGHNAPQCVWRSHGLYWFATGDWQRAVACLQGAATRDVDDRIVLYKLALALERAGRVEDAQRTFQRVELMMQLQASKRDLLKQMRPVRPESLNEPSTEPFSSTLKSAVLATGNLLVQLDRCGEAIPFFEHVLVRIPESAEAREKLARCKEQAQSPQVCGQVQGAEGNWSGMENLSDMQVADLQVGAPIQLRSGRSRPGDDRPAPNSAGRRELPTIELVDHHRDAGIDFQYFNGQTGFKYLLETTGGGVAVLDYDGDGWPDLYFPQGCRIPFDQADATHTDRLYRNLANGLFADVSSGAMLHDNQYGQGCAAADYNNDGFADLAVANFGTNVIYQNNGDGTFTDVTPAAGIGGRHYSTSLGWGDLDRDGNLDLYVVNYVLDPLRICYKKNGAAATCHPESFAGENDILYVSRGDGMFVNATQPAGMVAGDGRGLGVVIADLNDDGWPDVYVANDSSPCFLFQNQGPDDGSGLKFAEIGLASGTAVNAEGHPTAAMGIACADLDGDGRLDLYVTNFYRETDILYLNRGDSLFEDATHRAGIAGATRLVLGWGTQAADFDLDGRPELFLTNGHIDDLRDEDMPWKMPPQLFYNLGEGAFADISRDSGEFFGGEYLGRGVARLDWNRDGRPELVVVHQDRPAALLKNETRSTGHRVVLELHGVRSNRDAIGARLRVVCASQLQVLEICGGDGYCATNEKRQFVGIGSATRIDVLDIQWPSGQSDHWIGIPADSELTLIEGQPPRIRLLDSGHP